MGLRVLLGELVSMQVFCLFKAIKIIKPFCPCPLKKKYLYCLGFFLDIKYICIGIMNYFFFYSQFIHFQDSFQKILLALCNHASDTNNIYKKHRVLIIYHLFVSLLLKEIKDGLGGAWAFVLRDVIYTLIHHINGR